MKTSNKGRMGGYNCVVCVKQVPDTQKVTGEAMKPDGTVNRAALPAIFNPDDRNALEAALAVREAHGGTVTVVTMGLPSACNVLRAALMCGADRAYLLTDRQAAGSDTLATSYILSQAVKSFNPDLVFCGRQAIDGDTAQTGPQIGEKLDCAVVTYLHRIEMDGDFAVAERDIGTGVETCRAKLPALFTVTDKFGELRPVRVRLAMKCKNARCALEVQNEVRAALGADATPDAVAAEAAKRVAALEAKGLLIGQLSCADVGCAADRCGFAGSPTSVAAIQSVVLTGGAYREYGVDEESIGQLVGSLIAEHTIG